jgi:hypothetical protein
MPWMMPARVSAHQPRRERWTWRKVTTSVLARSHPPSTQILLRCPHATQCVSFAASLVLQIAAGARGNGGALVAAVVAIGRWIALSVS